MAIQKWGSLDTSAVLKQREEAEKQKGSGMFFKVEEGRAKLRFLPPRIGEVTIFSVAFQHYGRFPGMQKARSFNCVLKMDPGGKRRCPGCEYVAQLRGGSFRDQEEADELSARMRVYSNIVNRAEENKGPQIYAFGETVYKKLIAMLEDPDVGGNFSDPENGFDIVITREGKDKNSTKYDVLRAKSDSPLGDFSWIDQMANLSTLIAVPTDKELADTLGLKEWPPSPVRAGQLGAKVADDDPPAAKPQRVASANVTDAEYEEGTAK